MLATSDSGPEGPSTFAANGAGQRPRPNVVGTRLVGWSCGREPTSTSSSEPPTRKRCCHRPPANGASDGADASTVQAPSTNDSREQGRPRSTNTSIHYVPVTEVTVRRCLSAPAQGVDVELPLPSPRRVPRETRSHERLRAIGQCCHRHDQPSPQSANPRARATPTTRCEPKSRDVRSAGTNANFTNAPRTRMATERVANHPDRPSVPSRVRKETEEAAGHPVVLPPHDWSQQHRQGIPGPSSAAEAAESDTREPSAIG